MDRFFFVGFWAIVSSLVSLSSPLCLWQSLFVLLGIACWPNSVVPSLSRSFVFVLVVLRSLAFHLFVFRLVRSRFACFAFAHIFSFAFTLVCFLFARFALSFVFVSLVLLLFTFRWFAFTLVCFDPLILPSLVYRSFVFTLARPLDLQSLAFHSIVFTLVRFCFVRFALARFLRARSFFFVSLVFRRNPTTCLCPFSCAFRYSIVRFSVCLFVFAAG